LAEYQPPINKVFYWLSLGHQVKAPVIGVRDNITKEVKHFGFFKGEIVIINIEFSLYLNPPIFKSRVYPVG
jgi:hypothetical protein